ncbi:MAG: S-adenosylmethionine:tRNA ribosyltransferase-isomerase [Candidatus Shikimatogenerans sp. JK-2022]|nr:S-adenosylmethionine:tRNA ribosyltransferase-isomerase [Candidatus Shikimatogenerans bostrichidophilus]
MIDFNKLKMLNKYKKVYAKFPNLYGVHKLMIFFLKNKKIVHDNLDNLYKYFNSNDVIIINDSKALPIKYKCYKIKNNIKSFITIYLIRELNKKYNIWDVLVNPARKVRVGNILYFDINNITIKSEILSNTTSKGRILKFYKKIKKDFFYTGKFLLHKKTYKNNNINVNNYQNYYAKKIGSIFLPTSGVYIDKNILLSLKLNNINILKITYHLNFNKYLIFNNKNIYNDIYLNYEKLIINNKFLHKINKIYKKNIKICAVGSNTIKALESLIAYKYKIIKFNGHINKMLPYPYKYKFFNSLITYFNDIYTINFLILLNLCGFNNVYKIYLEAIKNNYKFNTYGDILLII